MELHDTALVRKEFAARLYGPFSFRAAGDIVAFLDRETARIDALVAKKQRLIELLEEKTSSGHH